MFDLLLDVAGKLPKDVAGAGDCFGYGGREAAPEEQECKTAGLDSFGVGSGFHYEEGLRRHGQSIP
jgi:hypothetical protein